MIKDYNSLLGIFRRFNIDERFLNLLHSKKRVMIIDGKKYKTVRGVNYLEVVCDGESVFEIRNKKSGYGTNVARFYELNFAIEYINWRTGNVIQKMFYFKGNHKHGYFNRYSSNVMKQNFFWNEHLLQ